MLAVPPAITPEQIKRLERLRNRSTCYEAVVKHPDGRKALLGYLGRNSLTGLCSAATNRAERVRVFLGQREFCAAAPAKKVKKIIFIGGGEIEFSGRTERDAIIEGELPRLPAIDQEVSE